MNEIWNWGDAISPTIYELVTGRSAVTVDYTEFPSDPHLMICGSTLKWASETSVIWGIGEISDTVRFVKENVEPLEVAAVRGPLTRKRLVDAGISCPEVYGDPALLFSSFYRSAVEKKFELGIIPHYVDANTQISENLRMDQRVKVIDITQEGRENKIYSFIDDVCECKRIASSSLHGMILADSYRIPSLWLEFSNNVVGKGFKFRDYFMSVGRPVTDPVQVSHDMIEVDRLIALIDKNQYEIRFQPERLLDCFPG